MYKNLKPIDFKQSLEGKPNTLLIDVRAEKERQNFKIENSVSLPMQEMSVDKVVDLVNNIKDTEVNVVFCCTGGSTSETALENLEDENDEWNDIKGKTVNVYNLYQGVRAYSSIS